MMNNDNLYIYILDNNFFFFCLYTADEFVQKAEMGDNFVHFLIFLAEKLSLSID